MIKRYLPIVLLFFFINSYGQHTNYFRYFSGVSLNTFEPTRDGGCIVNCFNNNFIVSKIDSTGQTEWTYTNNQFNGQDSSNGLSVIRQTLDGGYIGVGALTPHGNDFDMIVIKFDSVGTIEWRRSFDIYFFDAFSDVFVESDTTYLAIGSFLNGTTAYNFISKLNKNGDTLWLKKDSIHQYNFGSVEGIFKINGFYYLFGQGVDSANNFSIQKIAKYDNIGNLLNIFSCYDTASIALKGGKYYLSHDTILNSYMKMQTSAGVYYYQINKYDLNGNKIETHFTVLNEANFDSDSTIMGVELTYNPLDSIFVLGEDFNTLIRFKFGYLFQDKNLPYEIKDFKRDKYSNILVGGNYDPDGFGLHPFIARFVDSVSAIGITTIEKTNDPFLLFPNPASDQVTIRPPADFISKGYSYSFRLFDESGKEIEVHNQKLFFDYTINLSHFPKGLYLIRILSNNQPISLKKIIIN